MSRIKLGIFRKETPINLILSNEPQAGKTTVILNDMLDKQRKEDCILLTFDRKNVQKDAIDKYKKLAEEKNVNIYRLITNKKDLKKVHTDRLKGNIYPITAILMGNIETMTEAKQVLSMQNTIGFKQTVTFDEIHRYIVGEESEFKAQIDNFVQELIQNNQCSEINFISATAHDIMYSNLSFSSVKEIKPYPGFKGLRNARWEIIDKNIFEELLYNYKYFKKTGVYLDPPQKLLEFIQMYSANDIIINMNREIQFHKYVAQVFPETTPYNSVEKDISKNIVGRSSCGVSQTFPHSKILYYQDVSSPSTAIQNIVQELGRVNGKHTPVIGTTSEIRDIVMNYLENLDKASKEGAYTLPLKERIEYFEGLRWKEPSVVPSNKHKRNRNIIRDTGYTPGTKEQCNEEFKDYFMPHICKETWTGKGWGERVKKEVGVQDPYTYDKIKHLNFITNTETSDHNRWLSERERYRLRIAKHPEKKGYVSTAWRKTQEFIKSAHFYDMNGKILAPKKDLGGRVLAKNNS